ncbi:acyl-CoA dehydrogenase family protein [Roseibium salinum]|nr:acyl-CoA dehydrogenase family protein [Roseibium salinum]
MKPFSAPLDDILFSLTHVAGAADLPHWDAELAAEIGGHFAAFAEEQLAPLNEPGDRQGCRLEDGRVYMPDGFREAYQVYAEQGWPGLTVPEDHGGQGLDAVVQAIVSEIFFRRQPQPADGRRARARGRQHAACVRHRRPAAAPHCLAGVRRGSRHHVPDRTGGGLGPVAHPLPGRTGGQRLEDHRREDLHLRGATRTSARGSFTWCLRAPPMTA